MAAQDQVRQYLAYWFQLGKKVFIKNGEAALLPQPVIRGDRYSDEFEECWQQISSLHSKDCYLEGTDQSIAELLTQPGRLALVPAVQCLYPCPIWECLR